MADLSSIFLQSFFQVSKFVMFLKDALIGSLLRLIQRMSSARKEDKLKVEDKGLKKALCPALAIPDDPSVRVC